MKEDVAVRKRTQIAKANRTMFLWIAVASALVGAAAVVGIFLGQQLFYNEKVLAEKSNTASILQDNLNVIDDLKKEVLVLDTNTDLAKVKAKPEDQALQVILDALPSDANSLALGASLQNKLLTGIPGLQAIESMQIDAIVAEEVEADAPVDIAVSSDTPASPGTEAAPAASAIGFAVTISGTQDALKQMLQQLERSIRTIEVTSSRFEAQNNGDFTLYLSGRAFYEPSRVLELKKKVVER